LLPGLFLLARPQAAEPVLRAFPRHRPTGVATMLVGGGWFLWKILQLGQSDFGDYKNLLFLLFAGTLIGSLLYVRDFLAVRGVAILILLSANTGLKAAFGLYDIPERLVLVGILYLFIVLALYYGVLPFKMRETVTALCASPGRLRLSGAVLTLMGLLLGIMAFLY
ncbi:MAG TPA: hypothetical protein VJ960_08085, partial [Oceanipulchritudo sp.]|nr:hypothetical protein [Oceanipulchritudo sp.]